MVDNKRIKNNEYMREYNKQHKEELKIRNKKNYQKNKDRFIELVKRPGLAFRIKHNSPDLADPNIWEELRKDKIKRSTQRIMNSPLYSIRKWSLCNRDTILSINGNCCSICGCKDYLQIHHKEYINDFNALTVLCKECHKKQHGINQNR
jgi:hypothetical protein